MKKKIIIILSILLLIFLIVRPIYNYLKKFKADRKSYVEQLHFDFSGSVDSVRVITNGVGFVHFHTTRGEVNRLREDSLNNALGRNGSIRFLAFKHDDDIEIFTATPALYLPGDSICINTDEETVIVYRHGKVISKDEVASHLQLAHAFSPGN